MKLKKIKETGLKNLLLIGILLMGGTFNALADFSIEGHYQGKNIYVQSPSDEDGFGFCINKVTVNGDIIPVDIYSSAFQIDLSEYNIAVGQEVIIVFEHDDGCRPKLLNPEALRPKSTFVLQEIEITNDGNLTWSTTKESGKLNFLVEQYKWNKWVVVGEVNGVGTPELNTYTFNVLPHSGENTIRLAQIDNTSKKRVTKTVKFNSDLVATPGLTNLSEKKILTFIANGQPVKTKYEIFDAFGNIVKKGYNSEIDYSTLKKGVYHINFDNANEKIIVK